MLGLGAMFKKRTENVLIAELTEHPQDLEKPSPFEWEERRLSRRGDRYYYAFKLDDEVEQKALRHFARRGVVRLSADEMDMIEPARTANTPRAIAERIEMQEQRLVQAQQDFATKTAEREITKTELGRATDPERIRALHALFRRQQEEVELCALLVEGIRKDVKALHDRYDRAVVDERRRRFEAARRPIDRAVSLFNQRLRAAYLDLNSAVGNGQLKQIGDLAVDQFLPYLDTGAGPPQVVDVKLKRCQIMPQIAIRPEGYIFRTLTLREAARMRRPETEEIEEQ